MTIKVTVTNSDSRESAVIKVQAQQPDGQATSQPDRELKGGRVDRAVRAQRAAAAGDRSPSVVGEAAPAPRPAASPPPAPVVTMQAGVKVTRLPGFTGDRRFMVDQADGEFSRAGVGIDITTGRAWEVACRD